MIEKARFVTRVFGYMTLLMIFLTVAGQVQAKDVSMWTYYKFGPFVTEYKSRDVNQGMVYDLAQLLGKRSEGKFNFKPTVFPRKRLDLYLAEGTPAVVVFVNPAWMQDKEKTKYFWTQSILTDRNEVVSRNTGKDPKRIVYNDVSTFYGMNLGGVTGRRYRGIDDDVKAGKIKRFDVSGEDQNLKKLLIGRVDFMTAPNSMLRFLIKKLDMEGKVYFSPKSLFSYTRHFMVTRDQEDVFQFIDQFVKNAETDEEWLAIKRKYGL